MIDSILPPDAANDPSSHQVTEPTCVMDAPCEMTGRAGTLERKHQFVIRNAL